MKIGIYAGTFDPITIGHIDVIEKASKIFDKVIVAIGVNPDKSKTMFSLDERMTMISKSTKKFGNIEISSFNGLLVDFAEKKKSKTIIRGLRAVTDFEYELQVGYANESLNNDIDTVFFMPHLKNSYISSSTFRAIYKEKGKIDHLVDESTYQYIKELERKWRLH